MTGASGSESELRDHLCRLAASLFDRGLTHGATGNISARTPDGGLLVSPTGTSFGRLDPERLSRFDQLGQLIGGDPPTKEIALHTAFYDTREAAGAVVHLHSCHAVAWSVQADVDTENLLPPITPYSIMKLGKVKLLPFFLPGDPAMGNAVRDLAGQRSAVVLANHGPVVAAPNLSAACDAIEELEQTARLALLLKGPQTANNVNFLTDTQVADVVENFNVEWN